MSEIYVATKKKRVLIRFKQEGVTADAEPISVRLSQPKLRVAMIKQRGFPGADGTPGLLAVEDDPAPTLGGNLTLNNFHFIGEVENTAFILDGGLI